MDYLYEELDFEFFDEDLINELYVGETDFITRLIDAVSKARAPYIGKARKPIKGNQDFFKIGDMIAEEFGFYSVSFSVPFDPSMNAFTYPITMNLDTNITKNKPMFIKDRGMKFDPNIQKLCIIVAVTAGVWFNEKITDREVTAAILHEIGHSFVLQSYRMIDILEANRIGLIFSYISLLILTTISSILNAGTKIGTLTDIARIRLMIQTLISRNEYKGWMNELNKKLSKHKLFTGISSVSEYISRVVKGVFTEIITIFSIPMKLIAIPTLTLNKILEPLSSENYAIDRSQEYMSDSFATMYGLGPEIGSFLSKITINNSNSGSKLDKALNTIPIVGALHETLNIPILLLTNTLNTHPSTPARINKILEELNKELKDSDLAPKTKEEIRKNIKDLEKLKDDCMNLPKDKRYDAEMVKRIWISYLFKHGEKSNDYEDYYTDLEARDKYVKNESSNTWGIEIDLK